VRHLHLGHLAKAFALREAPSTVTTRSKGVSLQQSARNAGTLSVHSKSSIARRADRRKVEDAEQRMTAVVRMQGRLSKKGGLMVTSGASEFQIADGNALERLVRR
jgi:ATP-dependent RNA helicase DDX31/DBP7